MSIRLFLRTAGALSRLFPTHGVGAVGSRPDCFSYRLPPLPLHGNLRYSRSSPFPRPEMFACFLHPPSIICT